MAVGGRYMGPIERRQPEQHGLFEPGRLNEQLKALEMVRILVQQSKTVEDEQKTTTEQAEKTLMSGFEKAVETIERDVKLSGFLQAISNAGGGTKVNLHRTISRKESTSDTLIAPVAVKLNTTNSYLLLLPDTRGEEKKVVGVSVSMYPVYDEKDGVLYARADNLCTPTKTYQNLMKEFETPDKFMETVRKEVLKAANTTLKKASTK